MGRSASHRQVKPWARRLDEILDRHNGYKKDGRRVASYRTQEERADVLRRGFNILDELGYKIENPENLAPKHIQALLAHWEEKGLSAATLQSNVTILRIYCGWIGKKGMVGPTESYLRDKSRAQRIYATPQDKSWSALGLDPAILIDVARQHEAWVGMALELQAAFGLRRKEALCLRPHAAAQSGVALLISDGSKGGRPRVIPIETDAQRQVLAKAQAFVLRRGGKDAPIGNPRRSLGQNLARYGNLLRLAGITKATLGITGHGLRAQYACDSLERKGVKAPARGGQLAQAEREQTEGAMRSVSEELGHSRLRVMGAYAGTIRWHDERGNLVRRRPPAAPGGAGQGGATAETQPGAQPDPYGRLESLASDRDAVRALLDRGDHPARIPFARCIAIGIAAGIEVKILDRRPNTARRQLQRLDPAAAVIPETALIGTLERANDWPLIWLRSGQSECRVGETLAAPFLRCIAALPDTRGRVGATPEVESLELEAGQFVRLDSVGSDRTRADE